MTNVDSNKLSIQEIYDNLLDKVSLSQLDYVRKYGFVLVISLSYGERLCSAVDGYNLSINNGYIVKSSFINSDLILDPILFSWRAFGLQESINEQVILIEFDDYSRNVYFEKRRKLLKGVPINWELKLSDEVLRKIMNKSIYQKNLWDEFKKMILRGKAKQIHMLIVKPINIHEEIGRLEKIKLEKIDTQKVYTIGISEEDIIAGKLVTTYDEYIYEVDKPRTVLALGKIDSKHEVVMKPFRGRVVQEDEQITVKPISDLLDGFQCRDYTEFPMLNE
ncbi:MAG: hypothetical protein KI793_29245 [Rivularia sp. (in: Bacteria)]|nr:hypothetical protein [Rivularia sp. MS3]